MPRRRKEEPFHDGSDMPSILSLNIQIILPKGGEPTDIMEALGNCLQQAVGQIRAAEANRAQEEAEYTAWKAQTPKELEEPFTVKADILTALGYGEAHGENH